MGKALIEIESRGRWKGGRILVDDIDGSVRVQFDDGKGCAAACFYLDQDEVRKLIDALVEYAIYAASEWL